MKTLTPSQALDLIKEHVQKAGSQTAFAKAHDMSAAYVSDTLTGRRDPSSAILSAVGLRRETIYIKTDDDKER